MANSVSLQTDVGSLGIRGLNALSLVLEAFSKDNVSPTAVAQMGTLGGLFRISGKLAEKVQDSLQRQSNTSWGRVAVSVGWHRGDTVGIMAERAGGRAIALLCLCLFNIHGTDRAGSILYHLSQRVLVDNTANCSVRQLCEVGALLHDKLATLGFGNEIARQITRIHAAYEELGLEAPKNLLDRPSVESTVELLYCISVVLQDRNKILRIKGSFGMGNILGLVTTLFPSDTMVTVQDVLIQRNSHESIILAFEDSNDSPSTFVLETRLTDPQDPLRTLIIESTPQSLNLDYSFAWEEWLAKWLRLRFLRANSKCSNELLSLCCDLAICTSAIMRKGLKTYSHERLGADVHIPLCNAGLLYFEDPYHLRRIRDCCMTILGVQPSKKQTDIRTAFENLAIAAENTISSLKCGCNDLNDCGNPREGWAWAASNPTTTCPRKTLWLEIGYAVQYNVLSFLIVPGQSATVRPSLESRGVIEFIDAVLGFSEAGSGMECSLLEKDLFHLVGARYQRGLVAGSSMSTLLPGVFRHVGWRPDEISSYELLDGRFIFENHYYDALISESDSNQTWASQNLEIEDTTYPKDSGIHSEIILTVKAGFNCLKLTTNVRIYEQMLQIRFSDIITASLGIVHLGYCSHSGMTPISDALRGHVITTSVAAPRAADRDKIAIAQTRNSPTARLLCCTLGTVPVFRDECCLNCAVTYVREIQQEMSLRRDACEDGRALKPPGFVIIV